MDEKKKYLNYFILGMDSNYVELFNVPKQNPNNLIAQVGLRLR